MQEQSSAGPALAWPQCVRDCEEILQRIARLLRQVARSAGLGEVLQDYAGQSYRQLTAMLKAAESDDAQPDLAERAGADGNQPLASISFALNGIRTVLHMLPAAMIRNKSDTIGEKECWTLTDIATLKAAFMNSLTIDALLRMEDHALFLGADETAVPFEQLAAKPGFKGGSNEV